MSKKSEDFVHLHVHSDYSQLDGCGKVSSYVEEAKKRGAPAISFTEHGSMRGYFKQHKECEEHDLKPIYGIEFYVSNDMHRRGLTDIEKADVTKGLKKNDQKIAIKKYEEKEGIRDRWHLTAWARNDKGLKNLFRLSTLAYTEGFYYKPRIDIDTLMQYSKGISIGTGCASSVIHDRVVQGKKRKALEIADRLRDKFGENLWLEIQPHDLQIQVDTNKFNLELKERWGKHARLLATQDAHYVHEEDSIHHEVLLCVGTRTFMSNPNRFKFGCDDFFLKTRKQMRKTFLANHPYMTKEQIKESLDNTVMFSEQANAKVNIDYHAALLPTVVVPEKFSNEWEYLKTLCSIGWKRREMAIRIAATAERLGISYANGKKMYLERLAYELSTLKRQNFISYFLIVHDLYDWTNRNGIMAGPGRGSVAGSLVAFLLGFTCVDPLEHNLIFERFINSDRCFPKGTKIKTKLGWKNIEDIIPLKDKVKTRFGYQTVLARPVRMTTESVLEFGFKVNGEQFSLVTTPNHVIFQKTAGKVEAKPASEFKLGEELILEEGYLHYLQGAVRHDHWKQTGMFAKVCASEDIKKQANRQKDLSALWPQIYGTASPKILLKKVRLFSAFSNNIYKGKRRLSRRFRTLCAVGVGSRFCEVVDFKRSKVCLRAQKNKITRRHNLHSRFSIGGFGILYRIKRLEGAKQEKIKNGQSVFWKEASSILSRSNFKTSQKTKKRRNVRAVSAHAISQLQNNRQAVSGMRKNFPCSDNETTYKQNMRRQLCKQSEVSKTPSGKISKKQKRVKAFNSVKENRQGVYKRAKQNLFVTNTNKTFKKTSARIASIRTISVKEPFEVYDLCVNKIHEYYANGFLVKNSDLPDIDMDFEDERRQEILDYLREKYGHANVAQIATVGRLSGKQCLKDVSRVLGVPYLEAQEVTGSLIEIEGKRDDGEGILERAFSEVEVCRDFDKKYPDVLKHSLVLEGLAKTLGIHAAGVVVTPDKVENYVPLETRKYKGQSVVVTAIDKKGVAAMGLVKLDVLGLKILTVFRDCINAIKDNKGIEIELEKIPLNDSKVLNLFTKQDFSGVFQYDTNSMLKASAGVTFDTFADVVAFNALNRPGTMRSGLTEQYVARKKNPELVKKHLFNEKVSEITSDALGIIVYQEHVIRIFVELAGYEPSEADKLRKAIGGSEGDEKINEEREKFIKGAKEHSGVPKEEAEKIMNAVVRFGSYSFNKSHATAYAMNAYWGQWLKCYYPLEYYWALLKSEIQGVKVQALAKDAKKRGVKILPPDVSISAKSFSIDKKQQAILGSLMDIKGVGEAAAETIVKNQPYKSFIEFLEEIDRRKCHRGVIVTLAKSGALDKLLPNVKWFLENVDVFLDKVNKKGLGSREIRIDLLKSAKEERFTKEEKQLTCMAVNPIAFGVHPLDVYKNFIKKNIKVKIVKAGGEDFFKKYDSKTVFIIGTIQKKKISRIGDFHTGPAPDKAKRKKMFWGAQTAAIFIEGSDNSHTRVKFDRDIFDAMLPVIDAGEGTAILVSVSVNDEYKSLRANFAINLELLRKQILEKVDLGLWESIVCGNHPALSYPWSSEKAKENYVENLGFKFRKKIFLFCGVVTSRKIIYDKRGSEMASFGLQGVDTHLQVVCFSAAWVLFAKERVKKKNFLLIQLERSKNKNGESFFFNGGTLKVLKKSSPC